MRQAMQINTTTTFPTVSRSEFYHYAKSNASTSSSPHSSIPINAEKEHVSSPTSHLSSTDAKAVSLIVKFLSKEEGYQSVSATLMKSYAPDSEASKKYHYLSTFYTTTLNDNNFDNFVISAINSGDNIDVFMETASSLFSVQENGAEDIILGSEAQLESFLDFTAQLSEDELSHFLTALEESPDELESTLEIASQMGKKAMSSYLEAASFAGKELKQFNTLVSETMSEQDDPEHLKRWLTAAAESGKQVMAFTVATANLSEDTRHRVSNQIVGRLEAGDENNFIRFIQTAEEKEVNALLDISERLNSDDMENLMKAASEAQNQTGKFIESLTKVSENRPKQMSDFLATASRSGSEMTTFLEMTSTLDLEFTGSLSHVDTVNYLKAVDDAKSADERRKITEQGSKMSTQEDLSNFLYAASTQQPSEREAFLSRVETLIHRSELSQFIAERANQGNEENEPGVYMKGMLSEDEYVDFQATMASSPSDKTLLNELIDLTDSLDKDARSGFLEAISSAGDEALEFTALFDRLSYDDKYDFLEITSELNDETQGKFIHEALRTDGTISKFIDVSNRVQENAQTAFVFTDFLSALSNAKDATEHEALVDFVDTLGPGQQRSFLSVAGLPGRDLEVLLKLGEKALIAENERMTIDGKAINFIELFDMIAAGKQSEQYVMTALDSAIKPAPKVDEIAALFINRSSGSLIETYA